MNPVHIYHNAYLKIDEFESSTERESPAGVSDLTGLGNIQM
jgi:hypothetical protein